LNFCVKTSRKVDINAFWIAAEQQRMADKGSFGRRTWDRDEYERMALERKKKQRDRQQPVVEKKTISREQLNFEANLNKRQVIRGQVGGMRGEGQGFRCSLCDLRFKDNLKFVDHLNSPQHMANSGEKKVKPATLEEVKKMYEQLVKKKYEQANKDDKLIDIQKDIDKHREKQEQTKMKRQQNQKSATEQPQNEVSQMMGFREFGSTKS
jgi:U4/U6.U5 tri-snRNP component SNU23